MSIYAAFAARRIFVLYKLVAVPGRAKLDKVPIDPVTLNPSNAQDPATWMLPAVALGLAAAVAPQLPHGGGVGIVISEGSGLFCVDLDGCLYPDGSQAPYVASVLERFPGAYVERSVSQTGLHVIGSYTGPFPEHSTQNVDLHAEFYTRRRFIALTDGTGDPSKDFTEQALAFAWTHFRYEPVAGANGSQEWTTTDDPACTITGTPEERIATLLRMKSFASKLSLAKVTFEDLHALNVEKLERQWPAKPDSKSGLSYDASSVDQAYFNHLMYGFANNCEAVYAYLFSGSCPLHRPKWDERPDYIRDTLIKAAALPKVWKPSRTSTAPVAGPSPAPSLIPKPPDTLEARDVIPALPAMVANSKDKFEATLDYVERMLESDGLLSFDEFRNAVMLQRGVVREVMKDEDYIAMRLLFEREKNFASIGKELMRDACLLVASRRRYDSGIEWLDQQTWDGVPRVKTFVHTHFGAEDNEYTRAVGRYMWSGLAGRMLQPGCQLDMVIALLSKQGTGKSTGLAALVPDPDYFTDGLDLHKDDDNFKRMLRGKVVVEIAEMAGLSKGDIDVVKRVITRKSEKWIEKYQVSETVFHRRCMLFASTNKREFLPADDTGQRRWLPVEITQINRDLIAADRSQLWAEGAVMWRQSGIAYAEAERLAAGLHKHYELTDVWQQRISEWLVTVPPTGGPMPCMRPLTLSEILHGALAMPFPQMDTAKEKRAARVLRALGYESKTVRLEGASVKRWVLNVPPPPG